MPKVPSRAAPDIVSTDFLAMLSAQSFVRWAQQTAAGVVDMRLLLVRIMICAVVLIGAADAHAWGRGGHRAVCLKAWDMMTAPARTAALDLLDIGNADQFAAMCYWADDVRRDRPETSAWHFIDSPPGQPIDMGRDCPDGKCIVAQIGKEIGVIKGQSSKADKAESLKFLVHFVGDIHQPLHVAFLGDRGGNAIKVIFRGKPTDLHSVWDHDLLEAKTDKGADPAKAILKAMSPTNRAIPGSLDPLVWAQETREITSAKNTAYVGVSGLQELGEEYVAQNYAIAIGQIEKAGLRLATLLNQLLVP